MFKKLFSLFAALTLSVGLWAEAVITYTATTSLQDLFDNFETFFISHDYDEGTSTGTVIFPNLMEIGNEAFKDCSALTSITLPASIQQIGDGAFKDCSALTSITLPASIQQIGDGAFANCENLQSITCKASQPPTFGEGAFENVSSEIPLYVPASSVDAYQSIFEEWFHNIQALPIAVGDQFKDEATGLYFEITSLETLKTVKVVSGKPIYSNSSYNIPSPVTYSDVEYIVTEIGQRAFFNCGKVTSITLPSTITTIGEGAFLSCGFSSIDLPAALTAIGNTAFIGCKNLQSITLPANVTTIDYNAFDGCTALQEVTFLGNACQNAIRIDVFKNVGATTPATLVLPDNWTGSKPDKDGNWYGGKFAVPTPVSTTYIDENGVEQNIDAWEVKDASEAVTWGTAGQTTWLVVSENVTISQRVTCQGDVHLILANNKTLNAQQGITVTDENKLTIYAQTEDLTQMGKLIADATNVNGAAGIGGREWRSGSNITINGGIVTTTGAGGAAGIGGGNGDAGSNIIINGGEVTATGGDYAAGIGGGMQGSGSNITINGGEVEATGGQWAAGIGGGSSKSGSNITINGGTVEATGGDGGAGIGGGMQGSGSNITINGGEVEATGGGDGAGIGGGGDGDGSNITINGGEVTTTGGDNAAGIGGGYGGSASDIYISDAYVLEAGADADNTEVIAHSSAQDIASSLNGKLYAKIEGLATPYTRSMTIDNWATVCLPYEATGFSGANFYRVNFYDGADKLYIEEVSSLVAGQPYIFQATAETVTIEHAGVATLTYGEEQKDRGLQGLFARTIIATDGSQAALSNNAVQWLESDLEITVPACRAYFDMNNVPRVEQPHSSAPLRCIRVPRQTPTDFENVTLDEDATKILRNGQLIIIRDGKEYNAQGMQLQ